MNFISNLIKRPHSIAAMSDAKGSSGNSPTTTAAAAAVQGAEETAAASAPAMSRCTNDTDLENLFDSASQDLDKLEEKHQLLIDNVGEPVEELLLEKPTTTRETIEQLLSNINFNLDQVTANEMEHLQAMSLEVCVDRIECDPTMLLLDYIGI